MAANFKSIDLDKLGMTVSILCAIHCLAMPFLLIAGIIGSLSWLNHPFIEWGLIILTLAIAGKSLIYSYRWKHQSITPLLLASVGALLLIISRIEIGVPEHFITALGGSILAISHYLNWSKLNTAQ